MGTSMAKTDASLQPVAEELENGTSGSSLFSYTWQGQQRRMAFRSLNNGMRLVVTAPAAEIDAAKTGWCCRAWPPWRPFRLCRCC